MSDDGLFLDDGYTAHRTLPAAPGLHPELRVQYRPALAKERIAYRAKLAGADPAAVDSFEIDLIARHKVVVNGSELRDKERLKQLRPAVRSHLLDLILGYAPEDEAADAKN